MTGFLCRSFENNWNIYKLLAHQKVSKEKVRWCEPRDPRSLTVTASSPPPLPGAAHPRGQGAPRKQGARSWPREPGDPLSVWGLSCELRGMAVA